MEEALAAIRQAITNDEAGEPTLAPRRATDLPQTTGRETNARGCSHRAQLRDRLIDEARELRSGDAAAAWAHKSLADKNKLTEACSGHFEGAFLARLEALGIADKDHPSVAAAPNPAALAAHEPNVRRSRPKRRMSDLLPNILA